MNRARDWLRQAEYDLELARLARKAGQHEWACFATQPTAEKALKGLILGLGSTAQPPKTHKLEDLLKKVKSQGVSVPSDVSLAAKEIEEAPMRHGAQITYGNTTTYGADKRPAYVATRYLDPSFGDKPPYERFHDVDAEESIKNAEKTLEWAQSHLPTES